MRLSQTFDDSLVASTFGSKDASHCWEMCALSLRGGASSRLSYAGMTGPRLTPFWKDHGH